MNTLICYTWEVLHENKYCLLKGYDWHHGMTINNLCCTWLLMNWIIKLVQYFKKTHWTSKALRFLFFFFPNIFNKIVMCTPKPIYASNDLLNSSLDIKLIMVSSRLRLNALMITPMPRSPNGIYFSVLAIVLLSIILCTRHECRTSNNRIFLKKKDFPMWCIL